MIIQQGLLRVRDEVRSAHPWDRVLGALCFLVIGFSLLQLALFSYGRDQSIYALVAREMLAGGIPYRDVWDFKPPGIFFVYALAQWMFGSSMWAPRLLEMLGLVTLVVVFWRLARTLLGSGLAGLMAATLACLTHVQLEFWHTGQPEVFGAVAIALAFTLLVAEPSSLRDRFVTELRTGLLLGVAFLFKPPMAGAVIVAAAYWLQRGRLQGQSALSLWRPMVALVLGAALPIALCVGWVASRGGWPAMQWTFFEFTPGYTKLGWEYRDAFSSLVYAGKEAFFKFSLLIPAGMIAMIAVRTAHGREREAIFLFAGTAAIQLCGVAMQAKFFPYHYSAILPLLAWLAGVGLYKVWLRVRRQPLGALAFLASCALLVGLRTGVRDVPGSFWERSLFRTRYALGLASVHTREELDQQLYYAADFNLAANRQVGQAIASSTPNGARIFVWGFEPAIYLFSQRKIASKYIYNVPQRVSWERERARSELLRDLQNLPDLVVIQHHDIFPFVTGDERDSARALETFPALETLFSQNYRWQQSVEDFDLYVPSNLRYAAKQ